MNIIGLYTAHGEPRRKILIVCKSKNCPRLKYVPILNCRELKRAPIKDVYWVTQSATAIALRVADASNDFMADQRQSVLQDNAGMRLHQTGCLGHQLLILILAPAAAAVASLHQDHQKLWWSRLDHMFRVTIASATVSIQRLVVLFKRK